MGANAWPYGLESSPSRPVDGVVPIYQFVLSWILLLPLLYYTTDTQPSLLSTSNSALMTTNASLLKTSQGFRPQVILYTVFMLTLVLAGYQRIWRGLVSNKLLLAGPLFAALSSIWSEAPLLTLRASVELFITTFFAFYLSERITTERLMKLLMFVGTVAAILSFALVLLAPAYGIYHRDGGSAWQGICSHKNGLGIGMSFLLTPVFFSSEKLALKVGYGSVLVFLIAMSQSRGAWFETVAIFVFAAWLAISRRLNSREAFLLTSATCVVIVAAVAATLSYLAPLMKVIGKDPTLTGRTDIYLAVLEAIFKHPVAGYGFGAFWFGINPESINIAQRLHWPNIGYAENGFLELWLELGTVGLLLSALLFVKAIRQSVKLIRSGNYNSCVGWFSMIIFLQLVTNIEGGIVMAPGNINWTLTLIAFIGMANETRKLSSSPRVNWSGADFNPSRESARMQVLSESSG
jgi:exopolysaccharide production protein ExoQ